jgi:hypothetical protein
MMMFTQFCSSGTLVPVTLDVPQGVHYLCNKDAGGQRYFVVNSTGSPVSLAIPGIVQRTSLFADRVEATSVIKHGTYGDEPGEVKEILPRKFGDAVGPPHSISVLK